jgi:hypothetical protein
MAVRDVVQAAAGALGGAAEETLYVEDVFSTYLYTGNGQGQYIKNGILLGDSATNGTHLHLTGDNLTDSAPTANTLTITGSTAVSTSVKKYGTGSIAFDGSGDYITTQTGAEHNLLNDFTIEFWVQSSLGGDQGLFCINKLSGSGQDGIAIRFSGTSLQYWVAGTGTVYTASGSYSSSTWYHIALVRSGNTNTLYVDGTSVHTSTQTPTFNSSQAIGIGRTYNDEPTLYTLNGYIDDLRVTKGRALYTGSFTPPTAALPLDTLSTGKGGLVWLKRRSSSLSHWLLDTSRGGSSILQSDNTNAAFSSTAVSFLSDGFSLDSANYNLINDTFASWAWRKCPKFFDVVTYAGDGVAGRTIAHNLGSVPGMIIVKGVDLARDWVVWHRSLASTEALSLNDTNAAYTASFFNNTAPTDSVFSVNNSLQTNGSGYNYVAYIFAHNNGDGEFGENADQDIIKCGSYTGVTYPNNTEINVGFEPQWVLIKNSSTTSGWTVWDVMRGAAVVPDANIAQAKLLEPNTSAAETDQPGIYPTQTGFVVKNGLTSISANGDTMIYIAIRRGPMKTPEAGTEVFATDFQGTGGVKPGYKASFPVDMGIWRDRDVVANTQITSRLTNDRLMYTNNSNAEASSTSYSFDYQNGFMDLSTTDTTRVGWMFRRAPSVMDVLAYTGDGTSGKTVTHNLTVAPELLIARQRTGGDWYVYSSVTTATKYLLLNATNAAVTESSVWNDTAPTSSVFTLGNATGVNRNNTAFISYLFATLDGVSKVGSYTGTGSNVNVDCGFSNGARFILIKRTDATAGWYLWDSERGIVAGNDPYLLLNSTDDENTSTDYIDPLASGFTVTSSASSDLNASGGTYLFLAIA